MANQAQQYALSLKQPWAALVVCGVKSIEVRRWPTARRGRILIHAARVADQRKAAWDRLTKDQRDLADLRGGIIGAVDLVDCLRYRDLDAFVADQALHCNEADWFDPAGLFGFKFARPSILPFRALPGWFRFFKVEASEAESAPQGVGEAAP